MGVGVGELNGPDRPPVGFSDQKTETLKQLKWKVQSWRFSNYEHIFWCQLDDVFTYNVSKSIVQIKVGKRKL